jgi:hypothetical protein
MKMVAVQIDQRNVNTGTLSSFVSGKRSAQAANLEEVEERVAKLRKATAGATETKDVENVGDGDGDADKIDIDDELDNDDDEEEDNDNEPGKVFIGTKCCHKSCSGSSLWWSGRQR